MEYRDRFSQAEYETIARGLIPEAMEDKWFIYYEDPILYLHLSWTGKLVYCVTLQRDNAGAHVVSAETLPEYQADPMHEKLLPWVMRHVLLGQDVEFPEF